MAKRLLLVALLFASLLLAACSSNATADDELRGSVYDAEGAMTLADEGFVEWLNWLQEAQGKPGMIFTASRDEARDLFIRGQAAYFAGHQNALDELQEQFGATPARDLNITHVPWQESRTVPNVQIEAAPAI